VEAINKKTISGIPRINSIKTTQSIFTAGRFDVRPNARSMPIGKEKAIPVTPIIMVSIIPPNRSVVTGSSPKPPTKNHPAKNGNEMLYRSKYFRYGNFSTKMGMKAKINNMNVRFTLQ